MKSQFNSLVWNSFMLLQLSTASHICTASHIWSILILFLNVNLWNPMLPAWSGCMKFY